MYLTDNQIDRLAKAIYGYMRKDLIARMAEVAERETDTFIGTEEAAKMLKLKPDTLRRKCSNGEIPCTKKGRKLLFSTRQLVRYITQ